MNFKEYTNTGKITNFVRLSNFTSRIRRMRVSMKVENRTEQKDIHK